MRHTRLKVRMAAARASTAHRRETERWAYKTSGNHQPPGRKATHRREARPPREPATPCSRKVRGGGARKGRAGALGMRRGETDEEAAHRGIRIQPGAPALTRNNIDGPTVAQVQTSTTAGNRPAHKKKISWNRPQDKIKHQSESPKREQGAEKARQQEGKYEPEEGKGGAYKRVSNRAQRTEQGPPIQNRVRAKAAKDSQRQRSNGASGGRKQRVPRRVYMGERGEAGGVVLKQQAAPKGVERDK